MAKKILIILSICISYGPTASAQKNVEKSCSSDFSFITNNVRKNYAGFYDKTQNREADLRAFTDSVSSAIDDIHTFEQCTELLKKWIHFFNDKHLGIAVKDPQQSDKNKSYTTTQHPSFRFLDKQTAYMRIPSFRLKYKPAIDSLLAANWNKLLRTPDFIIDIRGNNGGGDGSFQKFLPLLYTNPYKLIGVEVRVTKDNIQRVVSLVERDDVPESSKKILRGWIKKMRGRRGSFVPIVKSHMVHRDTTYRYPRRVAILIDDGVYSSAESFLIHTQESKKRVVLGEHTGGAIDYANVDVKELPSGLRKIGIPTSRSLRLPENPIDPTGIAPDVVIPKDVEDWISFTRGYLRSQN